MNLYTVVNACGSTAAKQKLLPSTSFPGGGAGVLFEISHNIPGVEGATNIPRKIEEMMIEEKEVLNMFEQVRVVYLTLTLQRTTTVTLSRARPRRKAV